MKNVNIIELNHSRPSNKHPFLSMEILRTILCFLILLYHCFNQDLIDNKIIDFCVQAAPFYFPTLFLFHFYFSYLTFASRNLAKIRHRLMRLFIPYIVWPLIFWIRKVYLNNERHKVLNMDEEYKNIISQLIIGRGLYFIFWFQFNLLIITIIFSIVALIAKRKSLYVFQVLFIISYILEYSGYLEKNVFNEYSENIKRSLGRTVKMLVFSITGFILASIKAMHILKVYRTKTIFISLVALIFIVNYQVYFSKRYYLEGFFIDLGAICMFTFFYMLPLDKITNINAMHLIKQMTTYTAGVYCLHLKVLDIFENNILIFRQKKFRGCILNYLICYLICFVGVKIFGRTRLRYLFM